MIQSINSDVSLVLKMDNKILKIVQLVGKLICF